MSSNSGFFSATLSTDFLELPQSLREKREIYRHFYSTDEIVGQAIDLHTELPLSKVRLAAPKPRTCPKGFDDAHDYGQYILSRFERMVQRVKLFQGLITMTHHIWLDGTTAPFVEDSRVDLPKHLKTKTVKKTVRTVNPDGTTSEKETETVVLRSSDDPEVQEYYRKNYQGWSRLEVLPIDRVKITSFSFSSDPKVELIPADTDRQLLDLAEGGDEDAARILEKMPPDLRDYLASGSLVPLNTDPNEGSFVSIVTTRRTSDNGELGQSILDRCLRTLIYREKLRQAQTSIASRAMTPKRIVTADGLSADQVEQLREQVDMSLVDPDYSIVANYEIRWEEMGSRDRLLDLSSEYEQTERRLLTGLGVTESLMSGESLFSGDRLKLEAINSRYLFLREILQDYVHTMLFEPVARRMGFVEKDKWGQEVVLYPRLSFSRLPLRDSQDTFDALFNLYQKGSVSIDLILEMLNIDPEDTKQKIKADLFTVNDSTFNEIVRSAASEVGRSLATDSDLTSKLADYLGLVLKPPADTDSGRF
jgi:hypothetical protein